MIINWKLNVAAEGSGGPEEERERYGSHIWFVSGPAESIQCKNEIPSKKKKISCSFQTVIIVVTFYIISDLPTETEKDLKNYIKAYS